MQTVEVEGRGTGGKGMNEGEAWRRARPMEAHHAFARPVAATEGGGARGVN